MKKQEFNKAVEAAMQKHGFTPADTRDFYPYLAAKHVTLTHSFSLETPPDNVRGSIVRFEGRTHRGGVFTPEEMRELADELSRLAALLDDLNGKRMVYEY